MKELFMATQSRLRHIANAGYKVEVIWKCEYDKLLKEDIEMQTFVKRLNINAPLKPRDAFFGGRTNAVKLKAEATADTQIKYYDVTSLYPWVNKYCEYPFGHPEIILKDFKDISQYFGQIKCTVVPPKGLYHPVLPYKTGNGKKLLFPLCRSCAETSNQHHCGHTSNERMLSGTWVSVELQKAVQLGYKIDSIEEVWHWHKTAKYDPMSKTGGLFTGYIDSFLKVKQESSGYPDSCTSPETKAQYIESYYLNEGIKLDPERIEPNPGLRSLGKIMLNSFWGYFGKAENRPKTVYVNDPAKLNKLMSAAGIVVQDLNFVNEDQIPLHPHR